jgi:hypothetical protein
VKFAPSAATQKSAISADWLNLALRAPFELDALERFAAQVVPKSKRSPDPELRRAPSAPFQVPLNPFLLRDTRNKETL